MPTTVALDDLPALADTDLGVSAWLDVPQQRVDRFADAVDDHQWIHVDPERARTGPFGGPIAHGYLTLALLIPLWSQLLDVDGATTKINYGLNRVRFPAPVPVGARLRLAGSLGAVSAIRGGFEIVADLTVEVEGGAKPACVAQPVFRFLR